MRWPVALVTFIYDLVVGDSWPLTAAVALILGAGVLVLRLDALGPTTLVLMIAFAVLVGAPLTVLIEVKRHLRKTAE